MVDTPLHALANVRAKDNGDGSFTLYTIIEGAAVTLSVDDIDGVLNKALANAAPADVVEGSTNALSTDLQRRLRVLSSLAAGTNIAPFSPAVTSSKLIAATAASAAILLPGAFTSVRVHVDRNAPGPVFFKFGAGADPTAVAPVAGGAAGDIDMDPGTVETFTVPAGTDRVAVISPSGAANVYFTPGAGS